MIVHTNERKRAFERYRIARIVIKPRGWFPIGTRGISRLRIAHTHATARLRVHAYVQKYVRECVRVYLDSPDSYIDPTDLISSSVIPWARTHLPTKEHLCEPIRNALATCSQVACPIRTAWIHYQSSINILPVWIGRCHSTEPRVKFLIRVISVYRNCDLSLLVFTTNRVRMTETRLTNSMSAIALFILGAKNATHTYVYIFLYLYIYLFIFWHFKI